MQRAIKERSVWSETILDKPLVIASYFGFRPIEAPRIGRIDLELTEDCGRHPHYNAGEKAALLRSCLEKGLEFESHPVTLAYRRTNSKKDAPEYTLHFMGTASAVAEATLLRATLSILGEDHHSNLVININCVGDKESLAAYERELTNYIRKSFGTLESHERDLLKKNIFELFETSEPRLVELRERAPATIAYLTGESRNYFKEVLEYIEVLDTEFRIAPELLGNKSFTSHAILTIKNEPGETLAVGYRYSRLCRRIGMKREIPMVAMTIFPTLKRGAPAKVYKHLPRPRFYLVHLGHEARMRCVPLIELLRREHVPVHHLLGQDKLTLQLNQAEAVGATHLIIIGHKEALDHTATVRNASTRAQDTIPIGALPHYLKNLPI